MKDIFITLTKNYADDPSLANDLWKEIEKIRRQAFAR